MTKKIEPASENSAPAVPTGGGADDTAGASDATVSRPGRPREIGGRKGPEPTRYGDWEKGGICSDF